MDKTPENVRDNPHQTNTKFKADRLSSLPEELIGKILSLLPIKLAVATSLLSPRWRYIWAHHLTALRIDPKMKKDMGIEYFISTVDHVFNQLTSPTIRIFDIYLPYVGCEATENFISSKLESWLSHICGLNVEVIKVHSDSCDAYFPLKLPTSLFNAKSLVELLFSEATLFSDLPPNHIVNLPNLTKFSLSSVRTSSSNRGFTTTLFKSCPMLEHLHLELTDAEKNYVINVSSPLLKTLTLDIDGTYDNNTKVVIDAPKLEHFVMVCNIESCHFVEIPTTLVSARIHLYNYLSPVYGLLRGISYIKSLILDGCSLQMFASRHCGDDARVPIFHNLTSLEIDCYIEDKEMLDLCSPLPANIFVKVKRMKITNIDGEGNDNEMVNYLVNNAIHLELLTIRSCFAYGLGSDRLRKEYNFCIALSKLSRSFPTLEIDYKGHYLRTSRSGLRS